MLCIRCGTPISGCGQLCEHCQPIEMARKEQELHQQRYSHNAAQARKSAILALKIFGVVVVLALLLAMLFVPKGLPNVPLPTLAGNSRNLCDQNMNCAVVYVAPWCPHCHTAVGRIQALKQEMTKHPNIGFEVIVGKASRSQLLPLAAKFGNDTLLDDRGVLYSAAGVNGVPSMFSVNSHLEVIGESPLYGGLPAEQLSELLIQKLNLEK